MWKISAYGRYKDFEKRPRLPAAALGARPAAAIGRVGREPGETSSSWAAKQAHKSQLELANQLLRFLASIRAARSASNFLSARQLILPARLPTWARSSTQTETPRITFLKNVNNACISSNV
jgi:hypothetical protein